MKKMLVAALVAVVGMAFTAPAFAVEHEFGGYWRTRAFSYNNFSGEDKTEAYDYQAVDTRTRLYYTAVLNDNLKLVNRFEMDADWGDQGYGDIGTDGKGNQTVEVKHTYADVTMGAVNAKIGAHYLELSRGFLFADDMMGATITYQGDGFAIPFVWVKPFDGGAGKDANDGDVDYYAIAPSFTAGSVVVNPVLLYATSDDIGAWNPGVHVSGPDFSFNGNEPALGVLGAVEDLDLFFFGLNLDATLGDAKVWFTGLYEDGTVEIAGAKDVDISAYILAAGASMNLGAADVHGQMFYASGENASDNDNEYEAFYVPSQNPWTGQSYYWAEIMGYGMMDDMVSNGSCGDKISNIMALNVGASMKPVEKLTLKADLWYAELAEEDVVKGEKDLGFEVDLGLTYELVENLNLDLIAAYLFAGDRTTMDPTTGLQFAADANPYELGARLSLSF